MSFDTVHKAVTELVNEVDSPFTRHGLTIGDRCRYDLIVNGRGEKTPVKDLPTCEVIGFTKYQVKIRFVGGYEKCSDPEKLTKL